MSTGATIATPNGSTPARRRGAFLFPDVPLRRVPARTAVLDRPRGRGPAALAENVPACEIVAVQPFMVEYLGAQCMRQIGLEPGAHVGAEGVVGGE
jgi:hypothetical protein